MSNLREIRKTFPTDSQAHFGFTEGGRSAFILRESWPYHTFTNTFTYVEMEEVCTKFGATPNSFDPPQLWGMFNFSSRYEFPANSQVLSVRSLAEDYVTWADGTPCHLDLSSWINTPAKRKELRYICYQIQKVGDVVSNKEMRLIPTPYTCLLYTSDAADE